jgi:hypothetical protein
MSPFESLLQLFLLMILFCGLMPLLGGGLLYQGLQKYNVTDVPLSKCMTVFCCATGAAYLLMMILGRVLPEAASVAGIAMGCLLIVLVEFALVGLMLKKFTSNAVLIEGGAVLVTNLVGYGLVLFAVSA